MGAAAVPIMVATTVIGTGMSLYMGYQQMQAQQAAQRAMWQGATRQMQHAERYRQPFEETLNMATVQEEVIAPELAKDQLYTSEFAAEMATRAGTDALFQAAQGAMYLEFEADEIMKQKEIERSFIVANAQKIRSTQRSFTAANGIMVGEGSARVMEGEITRAAMEDASVLYISGQNEAFIKKLESERMMEEGRNIYEEQFHEAMRLRKEGEDVATATLLSGRAKAQEMRASAGQYIERTIAAQGGYYDTAAQTAQVQANIYRTMGSMWQSATNNVMGGFQAWGSFGSSNLGVRSA